MSNSYSYAIFSALYAPHTGGVESFTQRLAHQLACEGNHVVVITSHVDRRSPSHEIQDDGVEVFRLPCFSLLGGRLPISRRNHAYKEMLSRLAQRDIDRVLVNVRFYRNSLEGVRFANRISAPAVVLDHGSAHLTLGNAFIDWFVERYEHAVTKKMMRMEPAFAGISQSSVDWLRHFGIETDYAIHNAIEVDGFKKAASRRDFRIDFNISDERTLVVFAGRLEPEKGALEFAQAARILGEGYECVMAGEGSLRKDIEKMRVPNLRLVGRIDQQDLSALLRDADVFCLPSRSEGFCTVLLEAAAQEAIPVMTHVGGTDEVMGWNPVRFGFALEDMDPRHIAEAIEQAAQADDMLGRELASFVDENYSWRETVSALERVFQALSIAGGESRR